jgi:hypothetical protein
LDQVDQVRQVHTQLFLAVKVKVKAVAILFLMELLQQAEVEVVEKIQKMV